MINLTQGNLTSVEWLKFFDTVILLVLASPNPKARFKRRPLHVSNLMQMSENNGFLSFPLDSVHVKFDV